MTDDIVQRLRAGNHRLCVGARLDPLGVDRPCDPCSESLDAADEIERLRAAIDGIRWVLDGEHGTMRHTTFARLDADDCREIAELLAVYPPPQENDHFRMDGKPKKSYHTRDEAWAAASSQSGKAYACSFCGLWHITSKSNRRYK